MAPLEALEESRLPKNPFLRVGALLQELRRVICDVLEHHSFEESVGLHRAPARLHGRPLPPRVFLDSDQEANVQQGWKECGPFAITRHLRTLGIRDLDPTIVARFLPKHFEGTMPFTLERFLREQGVIPELWNASSLTRERKAQFLRERVAGGQAVTLLVHTRVQSIRRKVLHYMTVVGYDEEAFSVSDPHYGPRKNGIHKHAPGNRHMYDEKLIDEWSNGRVGPLFAGTAITVKA